MATTIYRMEWNASCESNYWYFASLDFEARTFSYMESSTYLAKPPKGLNSILPVDSEF